MLPPGLPPPPPPKASKSDLEKFLRERSCLRNIKLCEGHLGMRDPKYCTFGKPKCDFAHWLGELSVPKEDFRGFWTRKWKDGDVDFNVWPNYQQSTASKERFRRAFLFEIVHGPAYIPNWAWGLAIHRRLIRPCDIGSNWNLSVPSDHDWPMLARAYEEGKTQQGTKLAVKQALRFPKYVATPPKAFATPPKASATPYTDVRLAGPDLPDWWHADFVGQRAVVEEKFFEDTDNESEEESVHKPKVLQPEDVVEKDAPNEAELTQDPKAWLGTEPTSVSLQDPKAWLGTEPTSVSLQDPKAWLGTVEQAQEGQASSSSSSWVPNPDAGHQKRGSNKAPKS